ncbi:MAG: hypothetical protein ACT4PT_12805 [Methanobacteriota archaeon]
MTEDTAALARYPAPVPRGAPHRESRSLLAAATGLAWLAAVLHGVTAGAAELGSESPVLFLIYTGIFQGFYGLGLGYQILLQYETAPGRSGSRAFRRAFYAIGVLVEAGLAVWFVAGGAAGTMVGAATVLAEVVLAGALVALYRQVPRRTATWG